jgi:hypothetical protein
MEGGLTTPTSSHRNWTSKGGHVTAKGCCWDNAGVESSYSTIKLKLDLDDDSGTLFTPAQLQRPLAFWIEG